jgi:hypothetical protein
MRIINVRNPKPHLFEVTSEKKNTFSSQRVRISQETISEAIKIINEAKKVREEESKKFSQNATFCFQ